MVSNQILSEHDINQLALRSTLLQASFNYERMQGGGFAMAQIPCLEKIYKDNKKGLAIALRNNLDFINTHPALVGFLLGLLISLEEQGENRETIQGLKVALFAPLAGIGDALFWFTLLPIAAGICSSLAISGNILGPILFFLIYLAVFALRFPLTKMGYRLGAQAVTRIKEQSELISKSATILGITVIGGLIATYVNIEIVKELVISEGNVVNIQTDFFDMIFPKLLPLAYTMLMFYLLRKKDASPILLIVITFALGIISSYFGIL